MSTQTDLLTGSGPTAAAVTSNVMNREDTQNGTTVTPVPASAGTNFSWVKSYQIEILVTNSLTMTAVMFGKLTTETVVGLNLWVYTGHASYTQATTPPTATGDNNVTAPTVNGASAVDCPLLSAPPAAYAAGPFTTTGKHGNIVELVLGIDSTTVTSGPALALPTVSWSWSEA